MTTNFARHEQFLRIWKLLEFLETSRRPLSDDELVSHLKESLGLASLSQRTLGRDCEFLASCGYPIERQTLPDGRKQGWQFNRQGNDGNWWMPREPLTLLEMTAFLLSREQMRFAEGTVLWSGVESLWSKIAATLPPSLADQVAVMRGVWHVEGRTQPAYADRPRLLSLLCAAVTACCEIDLHLSATANEADSATSGDAAPTAPGGQLLTRFQPRGLVVRVGGVGLIGFPDGAATGPPVLISLEHITNAKTRDKVFEPCRETVRELLGRAIWPDGTPVD
jgi:hypothetical protein